MLLCSHDDDNQTSTPSNQQVTSNVGSSARNTLFYFSILLHSILLVPLKLFRRNAIVVELAMRVQALPRPRVKVVFYFPKPTPTNVYTNETEA